MITSPILPSKSVAPFEVSAKYYDLFHGDRPYKEEAERAMHWFGNKGFRHVCEIGCGTGLHALHFIEKGYQWEGVDPSPQMVARCLDKGNTAVRLGSLPLAKASNLFAGFTVVNYAAVGLNPYSLFHAYRNHIYLGGIFVFDSLQYSAALRDTHRGPFTVRKFDGDGNAVERTIEKQFNPTSGNVIAKITIAGVEEYHCQRTFSEPEIRSVLEAARFNVLAVDKGEPLVKEADWHPFLTPDDWSMLVVAEAI